METAERILAWLTSIPDGLVYLLLGVAAAVENIVPPIPADVMVLTGGIIAGAGGVRPGVLFLVVWTGNVASALLVYGVGRRYGGRFFDGRLGSFLLAPAQVQALSRAYLRFGVPIIFFSRFLPVFRPVVPAFAGVCRVGFWRTALPVALASGVWYGMLVYLGVAAGENWRAVVDFLGRVGGWLWLVAGVLIALFTWWWLRTRRATPGTGFDP